MAKFVTLNDKETQEELYPRTSTEAIVDIAKRFYSKEEVDALHSGFVDSKTVDNKVAEAVSNLVGKAPDTLDTLEEMATALQEKGAVVDALDAAITNKADKSVVDEIKNNETEIKFSTERISGAETLGSITVAGTTYNVSGASSGSSYDPSSNVIRLHDSEWGEFERDIISQPDQEIDGGHLVETVISMIIEGRIPIIDFGTFRIPVSGTYDGTAYENMVGKNVKTFTLVSSHDYPTGAIPNMMYARFEWDSSTNKTKITCVLPSLN